MLSAFGLGSTNTGGTLNLAGNTALAGYVKLDSLSIDVNNVYTFDKNMHLTLAFVNIIMASLFGKTLFESGTDFHVMHVTFVTEMTFFM